MSKNYLCFWIEFPTNSLEMTAVANIFDVNGDGFIDYYEFVSALHPSRDPYRRTVDVDQINEEVLFSFQTHIYYSIKEKSGILLSRTASNIYVHFLQ